MSNQRILMNIPAGQRKPKPVPIGKKRVLITNIKDTNGQVELSIPNLAADICDYKVIPYNSSQHFVTCDIDFFGQTICCYNIDVGGEIELEIIDIP